LPAVLDDAGGILAYGRSRRLASAGQRKALFARDRGCTFPGCTRTAAQSEIHHTTDWARGGHTNLNTMAIACGYHNTEAPAQREFKESWQHLIDWGVVCGCESQAESAEAGFAGSAGASARGAAAVLAVDWSRASDAYGGGVGRRAELDRG